MEPGNILNIQSLDEGWTDKDVVMLHACFQLLTDYVEKEEKTIPTDWEQSSEHKSVKAEIDVLYEWWSNRPKDTNELDRLQFETDSEMLIRLVKVRGYLWT